MKRFIIFLAIAALTAGMAGCSLFGPRTIEIRNWNDLNAVRNNLRGSYILMNDLDSTTAGYQELAGPTANEGKGWQPIGNSQNLFAGTFDGRAYEIRDLFSNRPGEMHVGLFGVVSEKGVIGNIGVANATLTGYGGVGALVGDNEGTVSNSYSSGSMNGIGWIGGLMGVNLGSVSKCYSIGSVSGDERVGGLVGWNEASSVSDSYSTGSVTGRYSVGGLVGASSGTVSNCHSTGSVTGDENVGGLVGENVNTVSSSYSTGSVAGNSTVGGLVGRNTGAVTDSFWDISTSGQATSAGGTGRTTGEMKAIATFTGAGWNIVAVDSLSERNPTYVWNILNGLSYPFLSWQA